MSYKSKFLKKNLKFNFNNLHFELASLNKLKAILKQVSKTAILSVIQQLSKLNDTLNNFL